MARLRYLSNARTGDKGTVCNGDMAITGDLNVSGDITYDEINIPLNQNLQGTLTVGRDDYGHDVLFYGDSPTYQWLWDESANKVVMKGATEHTGNLTMESASFIYFNTAAAAIQASGVGTLALTAGTEITIAATTMTLTGALVVVGTIASNGSIVITPASAQTIIDIVADTWEHGTFINLDFGAAETLDGDTIGISLDFNAGPVTMTTHYDVTGYLVKTPAFAQSDNNATLITGFDLPVAGALNQSTAGSIVWKGLNIVLPDQQESTGTATSYGICVTGGSVTSGNQYGIYVTGTTFANGVYAYITAPTAGINGVYSYITASAGWSAGNVVAIRGKVVVSGANDYVSVTGVWAGLAFSSSTGTCTGLTCALNVEVSSDNITCPNAIIYIQSLPDSSGADFSGVPYIVFSETATNSAAGSNILFELGHVHAATTTTIEAGTLFWQDTIQIAVNTSAGTREAYYIPLSTAQGTFTSAYPVVLTNATALGITSTITTQYTYPFFVKATLADTITGGIFSSTYIRTTIAADTDMTSGAVHSIKAILRIYGSGSTTALSANGGFSGISAEYFTDNETIAVTAGVHSGLSGSTCVGSGYTLTGAAELCCIAAMDASNGSAAIPAWNWSGVYIAGHSNKTMGNAIKVHTCITNFLEIVNDKAIASSTAIDPLTTIQAVASTGFIRVSVGGQTRYIALYNATN